jgi:hypothetical protein
MKHITQRMDEDLSVASWIRAGRVRREEKRRTEDRDQENFKAPSRQRMARHSQLGIATLQPSGSAVAWTAGAKTAIAAGGS